MPLSAWPRRRSMSSPTDDSSTGEGGGSEQAPAQWRFLVDENLPRELAARLHAAGYVARPYEVGRVRVRRSHLHSLALGEGARRRHRRPDLPRALDQQFQRLPPVADGLLI